MLREWRGVWDEFRNWLASGTEQAATLLTLDEVVAIKA